MLLLAPAFAATLQVGADKPHATPCAAAAVADDGDTVEIDAGTYVGDVCAWTASNLTIRGVGGYAVLDADGEAAMGKAIWVIQGDATTVEWIAFSGATVPDRNGAGIRQEGTDLTVEHCWFHDNENGILTGADPESDIVVTHSIFERNGYGDGLSHNLYVGQVRSLTFAYNWSHHSYVGHQLKSRAARNHVLYNVLADGADGQGSYQVDLPNGGVALLLGNVIQQGPAAENGGMVSFAAEGATHPEQALYVINNTLVNDRGAGTFVRNASEAAAVVTNNLFVGGGTALDGPGTLTTNLETADGAFVDAAAGDYHLRAGAAAIDAGTDPGTADGVSAWPEWMPGTDGEEARPVVGALDIGAYEFGAAPDTGDTAADTDDTAADTDTDTDSGADPADDTADEAAGDGACGCATGGGAGWAALGAFAALLRRRRVAGAGL